MRLARPAGSVGRHQRAGMTGRQRAVDEQVADHFGQLEQAQRVGDMAAALADDVAEIGLGVVVLVDQLLIALRLLDRIEVGALHVLDDGEFERGAVVDVAHQHRDVVQPGALRRAPAPFAGNDLVSAVGLAANQHRLDDAVLTDRLREIGKFGLGEVAARIFGIGRNELDRHAAVCGGNCVGCFSSRGRGRSISPISAASPRPSLFLDWSSFIMNPVCFEFRIERYAARSRRSRRITSEASCR